MYPDLFSFGPFTVHTYGLFVAIGFLAGLLVTVKIGKAQGIRTQQVVDMGFVMILSGMAGSRLFYVIMNLPYYLRHPMAALKVWEGGLVFSGGIMVVVATLLWYTKRHSLSIWQVGDLWAPGVALGQGIGRLGCFMAGCCYGRPTDLKWGVVFTHPHALAPTHISLHPTQIYASISALFIFLVLYVLHPRRRFEGQVFLWFLILHSTARLAIERFRGDDRGILLATNMSFTQFLTTFILLAAVITLIVFNSKQRKKTQLE